MGSDRERAVDVRVIAATSRDLVQLVREGKFREDLYHRIAETVLTLPPLRERPLDLEHIAKLLLKTLKCPLPLAADALVLLQQQPWSGNVRALRSILRQAAELAQGSTYIRAEHIARLPTLESFGADAGSAAAGPSVVETPVVETPVAFPQLVRNVGEALLRSGQLPALPVSGYERRALHRAALIYLAVERGKNALTAALLNQWVQLFGARWSQSENQRGLRDVMRLLGAAFRNDAARRWVLAIVEA
jgi:transcriptional regulator of acetoin/glycerol metabolism